MKRNQLGACLLTTACLIAAGCSTVSITTDSDPSASLAERKTYALAKDPVTAPATVPVKPDPILRQVTRKALRGELEGKGIKEIDPAKASMLVAFSILTEPVNGDVYFAAFEWGGRPSKVYDPGTIVVQVHEPDSERVIWHGAALGAVRPESTPNAQSQSVSNAVRRLMKGFPPRQKKRSTQLGGGYGF